MLQDYLDWLNRHQVQDADSLLKSVTEVLRESGEQESKLKTQSTTDSVEYWQRALDFPLADERLTQIKPALTLEDDSSVTEPESDTD